MSTVTLAEARTTLSELVHRLAAGSEMVITKHNQPVARLVAGQPNPAKRKLGTLQGTVLPIAPDFDAELRI